MGLSSRPWVMRVWLWISLAYAQVKTPPRTAERHDSCTSLQVHKRNEKETEAG